MTIATGPSATIPPAGPVAGNPHRLVERTRRHRAMGGVVTLAVAHLPRSEASAERDLRAVGARIDAWAARLTRFEEGSELAGLNRGAAIGSTRVSPMLGALLEASQEATALTGGDVQVTLLDARLAAERGEPSRSSTADWQLERRGRACWVHRGGPVTFDLDGVAKGWMADRALRLLHRYPAALVDADGDVAVRTTAPSRWAVAVADPRRAGVDLATLVAPPAFEGRHLGVATSGTNVHRWEHPHGWTHHLIDPRTGSPAVTDVLQATVVADTSLSAEALAKAVVIRGAEGGLHALERGGAYAALVLLTDGRVVMTAPTAAWLG